MRAQWPEIRLIWLLTASIGSLFSEQNLNEYRGNVTSHCLANGSWYMDACGPMGAELLTYPRWIARGYTAGFVEIDARIFDSYASTVIKRSREMGASSNDFFPELVQAARNWEAVRSVGDKLLRGDFGDDDAAKAAPFVYHMCRNHRHEAQARGLTYDTPNSYYDLAPGSIERITGQFLWDTCAPHHKIHKHAQHTFIPSSICHPWPTHFEQLVSNLHLRDRSGQQQRIEIRRVYLQLQQQFWLLSWDCTRQ